MPAARSSTLEFWNRYDGDFTMIEANRAPARYQRFHNHIRPHQALDWKTPNEYLQQSKDYPTQSHM